MYTALVRKVMVSPSSIMSLNNLTSYLNNASQFTALHNQSIILTHLIPTGINSRNDMTVESLISNSITVLFTAHFTHEKE
jgi:hypothetical protein